MDTSLWRVSNAYKMQPSLSERMGVDGHGCHTATFRCQSQRKSRQGSYVVLVT